MMDRRRLLEKRYADYLTNRPAFLRMYLELAGSERSRESVNMENSPAVIQNSIAHRLRGRKLVSKVAR